MRFSKFNNLQPLSFFVKHKRFTSLLSIVLIMSFLNLVIGCSYYNVQSTTTSPETFSSQIDEFNATQKYAIIHSGESSWHLDNLVLNEDNKTISGTALTVDESHVPLNPRDSQRVHRYKKSQSPLNEVHFNVSNTIIPEYGSQMTIPFSEIVSISVNDKNNGRSIANVFFGTLGVLTAVFIIILATKSSCPFIYVKNGEEYIFTGELYPGILTANQQRDDFILLPSISTTDKEYTIKITNELKEIQYTDFVQLLEISHPDNIKVLLDSKGKPHTFSNLTQTNDVLVDNIISDAAPALAKDGNSYLFNSELKNDNSLRNIKLQFKRTKQAKKAKLFLTLKNSMWLDYVFGKFNEKFGTYYPKFQRDQQNSSAEKSDRWMKEQNIPLSIYLKTEEGWRLIQRVNPVGPMATRDMVIPINLAKVYGDNLIIKLETGFMFWEVDYAGIDFTENLSLNINTISPSKAMVGNIDVANLLTSVDKDYLVQPNIGDQVVVQFKLDKTNQALNNTYYLKNRGYYNYIREYHTEPDFQELRLFREAGAFTDFSMFEYKAMMNYQNQNNTVLSTR